MTGIAPAPIPLVQLERARHLPPRPTVALTIDGRAVDAPEGNTILQACAAIGIEIPTLCYLESLHPVNVCRICVVEIEGARVLAPACSRKVEPNMVVHTNSDRVRHSRKLVIEMLASSVDLSLVPEVPDWLREYGAKPERFGPPAPPAAEGERDAHVPGHHALTPVGFAATVKQPPKIDNELYVRDYAKCILCYKCVEACGPDHQNTFAIAIAGRGFDARVSTELATPLPNSACVYCGNCIAVCPTGALIPSTEFRMRAEGMWRPVEQTKTDTICPYCGVGCTLTLHVQDNRVLKATSPFESSVTMGNLCIKGRFGWQFVQNAGTHEQVPANPEPAPAVAPPAVG